MVVISVVLNSLVVDLVCCEREERSALVRTSSAKGWRRTVSALGATSSLVVMNGEEDGVVAVHRESSASNDTLVVL